MNTEIKDSEVPSGIISLLKIPIVLYDAVNDIIFESEFIIQNVTVNFRNNLHNKVDDLDSIKYSGKCKNTGDDGVILLGGL